MFRRRRRLRRRLRRHRRRHRLRRRRRPRVYALLMFLPIALDLYV